MESSQQQIQPLWDVIPKLFLLPLKGPGILVLLVFSFLATIFLRGASFTALIAFLFSGAAFSLSILPSILIPMLLLFAVIKYGMEILRNTAEGHLESPELTFKVLNENYDLPLKQLGLLFIPYLLFAQADSFFTYILVINIIVFYWFTLPASVMTLAYTQSAFAAINPLGLINLISRIGWSYAILYAFLLLLNGSATAAYYFFITDHSSTSAVFLDLVFQIYFAWVMYGMMGYVLYQHHQNIGYDLAEDASELNEQTIALAGFNQLVADEDYKGAQAALKQIIIQDPDNLELRKQFHKIVKMSGHDKQLTMHALTFIGRLITAKQLVDAVNVYLDCIKVDGDFRPENQTDYLPLVEEMRRMRLYKLAVELSSGFHQRFPQSEYIPQLYLLVSKILIEDLSQNAKAKAILSFLKKTYNDHEIEVEVDNYVRFLTNVTA